MDSTHQVTKLLGAQLDSKVPVWTVKQGHFCLNGTVTPYPCGKGKYTNPGQSVCQKCLAGRYCDSETTTETAMNTTLLCPAGKYCTVGLKDVSEAEACSKAHYCPEGLLLKHISMKELQVLVITSIHCLFIYLMICQRQVNLQ